MHSPRSSGRRQQTDNDVGTLWTMQRLGRTARCALIDWPGGWEVRVLVDGDVLLTERCGRADDAFALADAWKLRMHDVGWKQIVPNSRPRINGHQSA